MADIFASSNFQRHSFQFNIQPSIIFPSINVLVHFRWVWILPSWTWSLSDHEKM